MFFNSCNYLLIVFHVPVLLLEWIDLATFGNTLLTPPQSHPVGKLRLYFSVVSAEH